MPFDIRFSLANRPGTTALAAEAVAAAGINILGMCGDIRPGEQWGFIHFLVDDVATAKDALERAGYEVLDIHEVDLVQAQNRTGELAQLLREYSTRGENIEVLYVGMDNHLVVGTESNRQPKVGRHVAETGYTDTRVKKEDG